MFGVIIITFFAQNSKCHGIGAIQWLGQFSQLLYFFFQENQLCPLQHPKVGRFAGKLKEPLFTLSTAHLTTSVIEIDFVEQPKPYYLRNPPSMKFPLVPSYNHHFSIKTGFFTHNSKTIYNTWRHSITGKMLLLIVIFFYENQLCLLQIPKIGRYGCKCKEPLFTSSTAHPTRTVIEIDFVEQHKTYKLRSHPSIRSELQSLLFYTNSFFAHNSKTIITRVMGLVPLHSWDYFLSMITVG